MLAVRLSVPAGRDLANLWRYGEDNWGAVRADAYVLEIRHALDRIANRPSLARPADDVRAGLRKLTVGSHAVYFRLTATTLRVVRILHGKMDPDRHL